MKRFWIIVAALALATPALGQINLLSADTITVKGTTISNGRVVTWSQPELLDGAASIFVGADSIADTAPDPKYLIVELRQGVKDAVGGDTLWGQWQVADSVAGTYADNSDLGSGSGVVEAYQIDASGLTVWQKQHFIQARFKFASGSQKWRIKAVLTTN